MAESSDRLTAPVLITRVCAVLLVMLALILVGMWFMPRIKRLGELQENKHSLEQRNNAISASINDLKMKQERLETYPEFAERIGHSEGLVSPDETVLKLTNETQNVQKPLQKKVNKAQKKPIRATTESR